MAAIRCRHDCDRAVRYEPASSVLNVGGAKADHYEIIWDSEVETRSR